MSNNFQKNPSSGNKVWPVIQKFFQIFYKLRGLILSIPVAIGAIVLAIRNQANLPDMVGVDIQATGEYAQMISKATAVWVPLGVTAVCIVFVLCSRRVVYPWLISLFSLVLPLLIWFTNIFPA